MDNSVDGPPGRWQLDLEKYCQSKSYPPPVFQILSDRRGGRTAWSSTVTAAGQNFSARFWYDGKHIKNAKEDAAEFALIQLGVIPPPSTTTPA